MNAGAAKAGGQAQVAAGFQAQAPERSSSGAAAASASGATPGAAQAAAGSAPYARAQQGPRAAACGVPNGMLGAAAGQPGALGSLPSGHQVLTPAQQALLAQILMTTNIKATREASSAAAAQKAAPMANAAMATDQTQISTIGQQTPAGTTVQPQMSGPNTSSPALNAATVSAAQQPQPGKAVASLPFQNRLVGPRPPQQQVSAATVSAQPESPLEKKRSRPLSGPSAKEGPAQPGNSASPACISPAVDAVNAAAARQLRPQGSHLAPGTYQGPQYRPAAPQQQLQPQQQLRPPSSSQAPPQALSQSAPPPTMTQEQLNGFLRMELAQAQAQHQRVVSTGAQAPPAGWCPWQLPMQRAQPGASSMPAQHPPAPAAMQVPPQTQSTQAMQQAHISAPRPALIQPPGLPSSAGLAHAPSGQALRPSHYIPWAPSAGGSDAAAMPPALLIGSAGPAAPTEAATGQRQPPQSPFTQAQPAVGSSGQVAGQKRAAQAPAMQQPGPAKRPHTEQPHTAAAQAPAAQQAGPITCPHAAQPHTAAAHMQAAQQPGPAKRPHTQQPHTTAAQPLSAPPQYLMHPQAQPLGGTPAAPRGGLGPAARSQPAPLPLPAAAPPVLALPLPHAVGEGSAAAGLRASIIVRLCLWPHDAALVWLPPAASKLTCRPVQCPVLKQGHAASLVKAMWRRSMSLQATQHYMESVLSAAKAEQERASQLEVTPCCACTK